MARPISISSITSPTVETLAEGETLTFEGLTVADLAEDNFVFATDDVIAGTAGDDVLAGAEANGNDHRLSGR